MSKTTSKTSSQDSVKPASLAKAVSLHMEGKLAEALDEINRVLETGEGTLEIFSAKAQIQFELEMYEDAAQSYAKLLSMHPKHANANLNMAVCLERMGRWQEAADFFEKAAEAQPDRLDARLGLGISQLHLEKSDAAAESFERVLEQQPEHVTALFGKAVTLQLQWKFDEAARIYQSILAANPEFEECIINLVTIGMARKDHAMISDYSEKLLRSGPIRRPRLKAWRPARSPPAITTRRCATAPS